MTEEDERTEDGKWKIEQCSVGPETAKVKLKSYLGHTGLSLNGVQLGRRVFGGEHLNFK